MAEEAKEKKKIGEVVKTAIKIIVGIALVLIGLLLVWRWRLPLWVVIRGCLGPFLVLAGVIVVAIAKE